MSLVQIVRERGPLTVAAFMDLALYHPAFGYYTRAVRRSGRAGDFFTSVDVGPLFGDLLELQIAEMAERLGGGSFDLVEAGASDGRLSGDILDVMQRRHPALYARTSLHLVEASARAREAQAEVLGSHRDRLATSAPTLPDRFSGVLLANELLDALPVHQVVMRESGLREIYVSVDRSRDGELTLSEGPPSTPALERYLRGAGAALEPGWRGEINLAALEWIKSAATRLRRGFMILIDYGHEAADLYSASHAGGTLTSFAAHRSQGPEAAPARPSWLDAPGDLDMTAHVDFTSVRKAARDAGLVEAGYLDQTYFVLGLADARQAADPHWSFKDRLALKTLLLPGGLGSTMKVLLLSTDACAEPLRACAFGQRVT